MCKWCEDGKCVLRGGIADDCTCGGSIDEMEECVYVDAEQAKQVSVLDKVIENAENIAEYDEAHEETRECSAEQKQLVLLLKELKARREAWEELTATLAKVADRYSGDTDTHREALSLLSMAERLEKEFSRYQNVGGNA